LTKLLADKDDDYKRYNLNYDNNKKGLEHELKKAYEEIRELRAEGLAFEQLKREHAKLYDEKEILVHKVKLLTPIENTDIPGAFQTNSDLHKKIELISADKDYLSRENMRLIETNKRIENKNDELSAELSESKRMVQKYLEDLLASRQNSSLSYEKRLNDDLNALREKNAVAACNTREN
jgi:hypothetical protein